MPAARPTAAILVIGDEVLRGETLDRNSGFLCLALTAAGIAVSRILTVPDELETVSVEIAGLCRRHTYVFTSGGIGPTPDDVTRQAAADALGVPLVLKDEAMQQMRERLGREPAAGQLEMCRWPEGAEVLWTATGGPSACIAGNLIVLPGVPQILEAIFGQIADRFSGIPEHTVSFDVQARESDFAALLGQYVADYPQLKFGSYPTRLENGWRVELRVRGDDAGVVASVAERLRSDMADLGGRQG